MKRILTLFILMGLVLIYGSSSVSAQVIGPSAYLTEQTEAHYYTNGTIDPSVTYPECAPDDNPCRYGYVQASLSNDVDTLQYLRINLSSTSGTNLNTVPSYGANAYKGFLTSNPTANTRRLVHVDVTWGPADYEYYNITNVTGAPVIELSLSYSNFQGGYNWYDEDNIGPGGSSNVLSFSLTATNPSAVKVLNGIDIRIQFERDTGPTGEDSVDVSSAPTAGFGTPGRTDTEPDGFYDLVTWAGNLNGGQSVTITFNVTIEELINYGDNNNSIDLDEGNLGPVADKGTSTYYDDTNTLTGRVFSGKFTRSSIRQGIELAQDPLSGNWTIRGLIKNMANDIAPNYLTYDVTGWGIYEVNATTGGIVPGAKQSGTFSPSQLTPSDGTITTTGSRSSSNVWYDTGTGTKPFYAASFDWEVLWNATNGEYYYGFINTTLDLPVLYKIDMENNETNFIGAIPVETANQPVTIEDHTEHVGSTNAPAPYIQILSVVPANTSDGDNYGVYFEINMSSVKFYLNSTSYQLLNDSTDAILTITQPAGGNDGLVNLTIYNLSAVNYAAGGEVGRYLSQNNPGEEIILVFDVLSSGQEQAGETFTFTGNSTMITPSGTPLTEPLRVLDVPVSAKVLTGYKDLVVLDAAEPNLVNATIVVRVSAGDFPDNITGIEFVDYVPQGVNILDYSVFFGDRFGGLTEWSEGPDYSRTSIGTTTLPDGTTVTIYNYTNATTTWTLYDGENITVIYQMNITTTGLYVLPAILSGFDPITGERFSAAAYGVTRVEIPESFIPPQVIDGELTLTRRVVVGEMVAWTKNVEVFNPNDRPTKAKLKISVFPDTVDASVSYFNILGQRIGVPVEFENTAEGKVIVSDIRLIPYETITLSVTVLTPPVLEIDRDVEVIGKSDVENMVDLKMDLYLKNFAEEEYINVIKNLAIGFPNIYKVTDAFGTVLAFTGGASASSITIDRIGSLEPKTIIVLYKQAYPTIIVTPDTDRYDPGSNVGLNILVIGAEEIPNPFIEIEIYGPTGGIVYANIIEIARLEPLEKTELFERYKIPSVAPAGIYTFVARLRTSDSFATLASYEGNFYVAGIAPGAGVFGFLAPAIIIIALILLFFSVRRLREVRRER